jgi:hypothetical protein
MALGMKAHRRNVLSTDKATKQTALLNAVDSERNAVIDEPRRNETRARLRGGYCAGDLLEKRSKKDCFGYGPVACSGALGGGGAAAVGAAAG